MIKDIREKIYPDWRDRPKTRIIEGVELGDVPSKVILDIIESGEAKPPNRSEIITVDRDNNMSYIITYWVNQMKTIAYLRVSTDQQDLDNQRLEIETYARTRNLKIDEFIQIEISSRKNGHDRKIDELLSKLKRGDCLIVSEISRLARSIREVHNIMHLLAKKKVEFHAIKQNLITRGMNDMSTNILVNSFAMCAEIERDLISARTKNGLALAKSRGVKLGNPNLPNINKNRKRAANEFAETLRGVLTAFVEQGLSQRAIVAELNKAGIKTRQNVNPWSLIQLQNVLKRLGLQTKYTRS